jgi:hypothetical protein
VLSIIRKLVQFLGGLAAHRVAQGHGRGGAQLDVLTLHRVTKRIGIVRPGHHPHRLAGGVDQMRLVAQRQRADQLGSEAGQLLFFGDAQGRVQRSLAFRHRGLEDLLRPPADFRV